MALKSFFTRIPDEFVTKIDIISKESGKRKEQISKEAFNLYFKDIK